MLIIGSIALQRLLELPREPVDIDIIGTYDECVQFTKSQSGKIMQCYPIERGKKMITKIRHWYDC